ncbi:hypothetical protein SAMN04487857_114109 [Pseudomonas sp. ok272]|uniref:hypothetical protein n=1 Tax=unclassified Pseudomonas TaxID=196821 RepID=UPI0008B5E87B|nr:MULTISPECIES: hypothetical protein [unclassified Pseudomonas]SEN36087.1 hypothetical protein SAMN04487857_114109 [Pseudomonas sp. ok272]SFM82799.1 hypothetical protein SAMN04487858_107124 [Pseudomonas sp. ok602]
MKHAHPLMLSLAAVGLLLFPLMAQSASTESVDPAGVQVQQQQQNGIAYLSGGIGLDESHFIQAAKGYNLHMTFSVGAQNQYTSDVSVQVQKASGGTVLALDNAGPLVYAQLPTGKYTVVATRNGEERRDVASIGGGAAHNLVFHWTGDR